MHAWGGCADRQRRGCRSLENGWVAEQNGDDDGEEDGEQPMPRSGRAIGLESASDRVSGR